MSRQCKTAFSFTHPCPIQPLDNLSQASHQLCICPNPVSFGLFVIAGDNLNIVSKYSCLTPQSQAQNCKGFWEKLISRLEYVKYAEPHLCFNSKVLKSEWDKLLLEEVNKNLGTMPLFGDPFVG